MTLRQLEIFVVVAESGTISKAAEVLAVSQPSITHQLHQLEVSLGVALLTRHPRGIRLTREGALALGQARKILSDVHHMSRRLDQDSTDFRGTFTLGVSPLSPISVNHFPTFYQSLHKKFPHVRIRMVESPVLELGESIKKGQVDLGLMPLPLLTSDLQCDPLWREELVLIGSREAMRAFSPTVALAALKDQGLILMKPGFGLNHTVTRLAMKSGFTPHVVAEVSSLQAMIGFVAAGIGMAIIPLDSVNLYVRAGLVQARPLAPRAYRQVALVYTEEALDTASSIIIRAIREYGGQIKNVVPSSATAITPP